MLMIRCPGNLLAAAFVFLARPAKQYTKNATSSNCWNVPYLLTFVLRLIEHGMKRGNGNEDVNTAIRRAGAIAMKQGSHGDDADDESEKIPIIERPKQPPMSEVYVFTMPDANGERIFGCMIGDSWMPLVTRDADAAEMLKAAARKLAKESGKRVKLVKFSQREDIWETS
jgi:hypothetical protein